VGVSVLSRRYATRKNAKEITCFDLACDKAPQALWANSPVRANPLWVKAPAIESRRELRQTYCVHVTKKSPDLSIRAGTAVR
jgi:hypothetical protein